MKKTAYWWLLMVIGCLSTFTAQAQERGRFKNAPRITPKTQPQPRPRLIDPTNVPDPLEAETTEMRAGTPFSPRKGQNPAVDEDGSNLDEGETSVVEIVDSLQIGDDMVKVASYYSIWDSRSIDPYGIDPLGFNQAIDIKLYDPPANRFWSAPLDQGKLTSAFGFRWGRWHTGADLDLETGDPVYSAFDGIVRVVGWDGSGYGRYVLVRHYNGLETLYGHLSKQMVEQGQSVKAGDQIGLGGSTGRSTGSHLHYETRYEGNAFSPLNLYKFPDNTLISDHFLLTPSVWDYLRGNSRSDYVAKPRYKRTVLHRVRSGETLSSIAGRYGMSVRTLASKNRLSSRSRIRPGQRLKVN